MSNSESEQASVSDVPSTQEGGILVPDRKIQTGRVDLTKKMDQLLGGELKRGTVALPAELRSFKVSEGESGLAVVTNQDSSQGIVRPREEQLEHFSKKTASTEKQLTKSELSSLFYKPSVFIVNRLKDKPAWSDGLGAEILHLWEICDFELDRYSCCRVLRDNGPERVFELLADLGIEIAQLMRLQDFAQDAKLIFNLVDRYQIFIESFRRASHYIAVYDGRLCPDNDNGRLHFLIPELGEMTDFFIQLLTENQDNSNLVVSILAILIRIELPASQQEYLLRFLDQAGLLSSPIAYNLTLDLSIKAREGAESSWISEQEARREELLAKLREMTPQECFDQFDSLAEEAEDLILATSLTQPTSGKVGLEIECNTDDESSFLKHDAPFGFWLGEDWGGVENSRFAKNLELRRKNDRLEFNADYLHSLGHLAVYLEQMSHLAGFHFHLDAGRHPEVFGDKNQSFLMRKPNLRGFRSGWSHFDHDHRTYEFRDFMPPAQTMGRSYQPADVANLIVMAITGPEPMRRMDAFHGTPLEFLRDGQTGQRLLVGERAKSVSWKQFLFGALVKDFRTAEGKLAALLALKNDNSMVSFDLLDVAGAYDDVGVVDVVELMLSFQDPFVMHKNKSSLCCLFRTIQFAHEVGEPEIDKIFLGVKDVLRIAAVLNVLDLGVVTDSFNTYVRSVIPELTEDFNRCCSVGQSLKKADKVRFLNLILPHLKDKHTLDAKTTEQLIVALQQKWIPDSYCSIFLQLLLERGQSLDKFIIWIIEKHGVEFFWSHVEQTKPRLIISGLLKVLLEGEIGIELSEKFWQYLVKMGSIYSFSRETQQKMVSVLDDYYFKNPTPENLHRIIFNLTEMTGNGVKFNLVVYKWIVDSILRPAVDYCLELEECQILEMVFELLNNSDDPRLANTLKHFVSKEAFPTAINDQIWKIITLKCSPSLVLELAKEIVSLEKGLVYRQKVWELLEAKGSDSIALQVTGIFNPDNLLVATLPRRELVQIKRRSWEYLEKFAGEKTATLLQLYLCFHWLKGEDKERAKEVLAKSDLQYLHSRLKDDYNIGLGQTSDIFTPKLIASKLRGREPKFNHFFEDYPWEYWWEGGSVMVANGLVNAIHNDQLSLTGMIKAWPIIVKYADQSTLQKVGSSLRAEDFSCSYFVDEMGVDEITQYVLDIYAQDMVGPKHRHFLTEGFSQLKKNFAFSLDQISNGFTVLFGLLTHQILLRASQHQEKIERWKQMAFFSAKYWLSWGLVALLLSTPGDTNEAIDQVLIDDNQAETSHIVDEEQLNIFRQALEALGTQLDAEVPSGQGIFQVESIHQETLAADISNEQRIELAEKDSSRTKRLSWEQVEVESSSEVGLESIPRFNKTDQGWVLPEGKVMHQVDGHTILHHRDLAPEQLKQHLYRESSILHQALNNFLESNPDYQIKQVDYRTDSDLLTVMQPDGTCWATLLVGKHVDRGDGGHSFSADLLVLQETDGGVQTRLLRPQDFSSISREGVAHDSSFDAFGFSNYAQNGFTIYYRDADQYLSAGTILLKSTDLVLSSQFAIDHSGGIYSGGRIEINNQGGIDYQEVGQVSVAEQNENGIVVDTQRFADQYASVVRRKSTVENDSQLMSVEVVDSEGEIIIDFPDWFEIGGSQEQELHASSRLFDMENRKYLLVIKVINFDEPNCMKEIQVDYGDGTAFVHDLSRTERSKIAYLTLQATEEGLEVVSKSVGDQYYFGSATEALQTDDGIRVRFHPSEQELPYGVKEVIVR